VGAVRFTCAAISVEASIRMTEVLQNMVGET
jgi:hypothetical protein